MGIDIVRSVDSCPPCRELLEVKVTNGLLIRSPDAQIEPVQSIKYLSGADMFPNLVGLPIANPAQFLRSSCEQKIAPSSGTGGELGLVSGETDGTVLILASNLSLSSIPRPMS